MCYELTGFGITFDIIYGSVCKVITQDTENFDEELESLFGKLVLMIYQSWRKK